MPPLTPDDSRFSIDELFDELALISFETAEEQAQLEGVEAEFWNITGIDENTSDSD